MKKFLTRWFILVLALTIPCMYTIQAAAYSETSARLTVTPVLCVIDVIQDGSNQTLQTSSSDCETALPVISSQPTFIATASPLFAQPFTGGAVGRQTPSGQQAARPMIEGSLTPIATQGPQTSAGSSDSTQLTRAIVGVALVLAATGIGIDMALFEFHYSKSIARWTHQRAAVRIFKK